MTPIVSRVDEIFEVGREHRRLQVGELQRAGDHDRAEHERRDEQRERDARGREERRTSAVSEHERRRERAFRPRVLGHRTEREQRDERDEREDAGARARGAASVPIRRQHAGHRHARIVRMRRLSVNAQCSALRRAVPRARVDQRSDRGGGRAARVAAELEMQVPVFGEQRQRRAAFGERGQQRVRRAPRACTRPASAPARDRGRPARSAASSGSSRACAGPDDAIRQRRDAIGDDHRPLREHRFERGGAGGEQHASAAIIASCAWPSTTRIAIARHRSAICRLFTSTSRKRAGTRRSPSARRLADRAAASRSSAPRR